MKKFWYFILTKSLGLYINFLSYIAPGRATELAYKFFTEPRNGKLSQNALPEVLLSARQEFITHETTQFPIYTWEGNQTRILLVHGWESNASRWELILPYLQKSGCTIMALDAPAHGLSKGTEFTIPSYAAFVHTLVQQFQPRFLIGHSIGGAACLYYQYKYPQSSIEKMVILGAPSDLRTLIRNYADILSLNIRVVDAIEKYFWDKFKVKVEDFSGKTFGKKLKIKGLIAHDLEDDIVAFEEGKKIAENWKDAIFIETKGLGHSMHDEHLYEQIYTFLFDSEKE